jgi:hypothetical protein
VPREPIVPPRALPPARTSKVVPPLTLTLLSTSPGPNSTMAPGLRCADAVLPLMNSMAPPLETVVAKALPPGSMTAVPPPLTRVTLATAPLSTTSTPPLDTVVAVSGAPPASSRVPPSMCQPLVALPPPLTLQCRR